MELSDAEIMTAMRAYYQDTHNLAEGAGAAALAGALKEKSLLKGKRVGIILTGILRSFELRLAAWRDVA